MSDPTADELHRLGNQIGLAVARDPGVVVLALLEYLLERSLGDNKALVYHFKLKAYRSIVKKLTDRGAL